MKLSQKWIEYLSNKPESGMGYQSAKIILKNGREYDANILNCSVVLSVDGVIGDCPFSEEQIDAITVREH